MTLPVEDETEIEASRAPLLEHLVELRARLIICSAALAAAFVVCFIFSTPIYSFLLEPLQRAEGCWRCRRRPAPTTGRSTLCWR